MVQMIYGDLTDDALEASKQVRTVGMDIETSLLPLVGGKLDKSRGKIAIIQVFIPNYGTVMIRELSTYPTNLTLLLESTRTAKIFHYALFDLYFILRDFPFIYPALIADTFIAARYYDPNKKIFESHRLSTLVETIFGYKMDKSLTVSDWLAPVLTPAQIQYAAKDVEYLPQLLDYMEKRIDPVHLPALLADYREIPHQVMIELKNGKH